MNNDVEDKERYQLDPNRWVDTLPQNKRKTKVSGKHYTIVAFLFVFGLILVSVIKNETRNLQKEISNFQASINNLKKELHLTNLDHEFITSPENISVLATKYLESDFSFYKKSQIKALDQEQKISTILEKEENINTKKRKNKNFKEKVKLEIVKQVEQKKMELQKIKEISSKPEELPDEITMVVAKKISKTKIKLKKFYSSPKETINLEKLPTWAGIQIVKAFLGIPVVPGK